ncbi:LOW QUALITY PROTEIN: hypothetical protein HID58_087916 [Brassica napus]|uniref:Uncharacterized protein n=1 Tax=Brassica napus TaxID=3708 RepID=A0ABQ7XUL9_BRANA|nr:LOW QUALITY PROTEIN: hypothetical protein HID58_087916 [Brassica napus]
MGWNRLSVVKIAGSSGSAVDGPDSRIGPWVPPDLSHLFYGAHGRNRWWSSRYAAGSMALRYALMSMECPYRYAGDRDLGQRNHLAWKTEEGPRLGNRDPGPRGMEPDLGAGTQDPEAGTRTLGTGTWKTEAGAGNNMTFFIGLYKFHRIITLPCRSFSDALALGMTCKTFFFCFMKMRCCPHGGDRPKLSETGNIGIKGDASDHTPGACAASLYSASAQAGLSDSTNRVEECMGQYPAILRGRILATLRIRRTKRLNMTPRPKLRILMLDFTGLACASRACKGFGASCLVSRSYLDFWVEGTFSMFVLVPGDNLVDSWYRSRSPTAICPSEVSHHQCWDDLASCFQGTQRILGMLAQNLEVLRYIFLKPIVREPDGCVDLQGDLSVYLFDLKSSSSGGLSLIARLFGAVYSFASSSYPLESLKDGTRCVKLVNLEYRDASHSTFQPGGELFFQMVDMGLDEYFQVLDLFEGDLVGFWTLILYFSGRQDLLSGLVTHDLGGMEIFVEAWRLLLLEDHNFFWLISTPSWTGVFLTPSLGIPVSYNLSRGAALETWKGTDPEFPREFVGGCREAVFPALGQGSFRRTTPMEVDEWFFGYLLVVAWYAREFVQVVNPGGKCCVPLENLASFSYEVEFLEVWMSSRACLVMAAPIGSEDPEPTGVNNCRHRLWDPKPTGTSDCEKSDLRIGPGIIRDQGLQEDPEPAGTMDCRKSDMRIGPGTSRNQGLQEDPKPAGTRDCGKSDLRIGPGTSRNQGLQKDPEPAGTRDCGKSDLRIGPGISRDQGLQEV